MLIFGQIKGSGRLFQSGIGSWTRITDISNESDMDLPAELREIEQLLREARPALTELELDEIKQGTKVSAARRSNKALAKKKGSSMKPKLTLIAVLALGILVGGTAATSAFAASAGSAQYAPEEEESHFCEESGGVETANGCEHEEEEVCDESSSGSDYGSGEASGSGSENCQHAEPVEEGTTPSGKLPYTGFPVAPALLVGLGLLGAGVAMRRHLHSGSDFA
jgi:hypothetical protein